MLDKIQFFLAKSKFNKERHFFYQDLSDALDGKQTLLDFLNKKRIRGQRRNDPCAIIYAKWVQGLNQGIPVARVMASVVPKSDVTVIHASEEIGNLTEGLKHLGGTIESINKMKSALLGSLIGPIIASVLLLGMLIGGSYMLIPMMLEMAPPEEWHPLGQILYAVSEVVMNYGIIIAILMCGAIYGFLWSRDNWCGPIRLRFDRFIPYSILRDYHGANFLIIMANMMSSGVSLGNALTLVQAHSSPWLRYHVSQMLLILNRVAVPADCFKTGIFSDEVMDRIKDHAEIAGIDIALSKIGDAVLDILKRRMKKVSVTLNLIALLVIAGCIGFAYMAVIFTIKGIGGDMTI